MPRLDAGHTVALDDPIAGRAVPRRGSGVLARRRDLLLRALRLRRRRDRRAGARPEGDRRAVQQRGPGAADGRGRAGRDRARERPPLPPAAPQGRRARPHARVQREHPRVARRRAGGVRRGRADRPLEPRARVASTASSRDEAIGRPLGEVFDAPFVEALRRGAARAPRRRDAVPGAADVARRAEDAAAAGQRDRGAAAGFRRATTPWSARSCSSRTSPTACGSRSSCRSPRRWRRSACWRPASRTR